MDIKGGGQRNWGHFFRQRVPEVYRFISQMLPLGNVLKMVY
jgi:hypothetical protein